MKPETRNPKLETRFGYFYKVLAIVSKDITAELRTKEMMSAMFVFSLLVIFIFNFAFDLRAENASTLAPGVLWVAIAFAGMLGLGRSFIIERDRGSLEGLLLAPVDRSAIYFGKFIGNVLFIATVEIVILPLFIVFFNLSIVIIPALVGVVILGTIGFAGVGTLFSAMVIHTRARDVLLPILLFPVIVPVLLSAVRLTAGIIDGLPLADVQNWLTLLIAFDLIFMAIAFILFEHVVEE
ncbi:MAG TPA: ABC transporter permease [Chloroflexi bacterium]|nr:ABC transporter permease [Chloroflexota bacterium]